MRFKTVRLTEIRNGPKRTISASGGLRNVTDKGVDSLSSYDQHKVISFFGLQWLSLLIPSKSRFKSGDKRQAYKIHRSEPLLHFALSTGCHSDPAVLKTSLQSFLFLFLT